MIPLPIAILICVLGLVVVTILVSIRGRHLFKKRVARYVARLLSTTASSVGPQELAHRWNSLPGPVRRHLEFAIEVGAPPIRTLRLEHGGTFRVKPGQRWLPIRGVEYFMSAVPGFVWSASISPFPFIWIDACDRLLNGHGNMLIRLQSIFALADVSGPEMDQGASLRWLSEAVWFPYAFVGDAIRWDPLSEDSAKVTMVQKGATVNATVNFDVGGRMVLFRADRNRDVGGGKSVLTPWVGRCSDYRKFEKFVVPSHVEVAWVLEGVEFVYARFDVTSIEYNS